jgi:hypothetical protein
MLTDAALKSLKPKEKSYKVTDRDGMYAGLPALPDVAYVRHTRSDPHPTIHRLAELISAAVLSI